MLLLIQQSPNGEKKNEEETKESVNYDAKEFRAIDIQNYC